MTNKTQSTINRKRLDQKVAALEEGCLKMFKEIAWARDQDCHDLERFFDILAGLQRVEDLKGKLSMAKSHRDHYASKIAAASIKSKPDPPWWKQLFRKGD